jgi:hypothetical protein
MRHLTTPPPPPLLLRVPALLPLNIYPPVLLPPPGPEAEYPFTGLLLLLLGPCVLRPVAEAVPAPDAGGDSEPEGGCGAPAVALRPSRCSSRGAGEAVQLAAIPASKASSRRRKMRSKISWTSGAAHVDLWVCRQVLYY